MPLRRTVSNATLPLGLPWLGAHFRIDALSAFFVIIVNLGSAAASLFALGYGRHEETPHRVLPFYPAYLAAMNLVVLADDAFSFLVSWEFMSLSSWALVVSHYRERENLRAGYVYLLMASFGTLALLLAFGLLAGANGNYAFDAIRASHPSAALAALVLILTLVGAGSKAGIVPLHAWLPLAHPAAPSHVSALMSGVMTKVAVYGFVRIAFDLFGEPAWWWSMPVLTVGGITAVMGVLYALMQHDLKRLRLSHHQKHRHHLYRAWSSARLQGIRPAGRLSASAHRRPVPRLQPLHLQELAVLRRRRRTQFDRRARHGASWRTYSPDAAIRVRVSRRLRRDFGIASTEWLRIGVDDVSGNLAEPTTTVLGLEISGACGGCVAGTVGGACAACFVKAFGVSFLGRPRTPAAANARETDNNSLAAMFFLFCIVPCRRHPARHFHRCTGAGDQFTGRREHARTRQVVDWLTIVPIAESRSSYNGLLVFVFVTLSGSISAFAISSVSLRQIATGTCLGLRLSGSERGDAIHGLELRPADPPGVRHRCVPRARNRRNATTGVDQTGAPYCGTA